MFIKSNMSKMRLFLAMLCGLQNLSSLDQGLGYGSESAES